MISRAISLNNSLIKQSFSSVVKGATLSDWKAHGDSSPFSVQISFSNSIHFNLSSFHSVSMPMLQDSAPHTVGGIMLEPYCLPFWYNLAVSGGPMYTWGCASSPPDFKNNACMCLELWIFCPPKLIIWTHYP